MPSAAYRQLLADATLPFLNKLPDACFCLRFAFALLHAFAKATASKRAKPRLSKRDGSDCTDSTSVLRFMVKRPPKWIDYPPGRWSNIAPCNFSNAIGHPVPTMVSSKRSQFSTSVCINTPNISSARCRTSSRVKLPSSRSSHKASDISAISGISEET